VLSLKDSERVLTITTGTPKDAKEADRCLVVCCSPQSTLEVTTERQLRTGSGRACSFFSVKTFRQRRLRNGYAPRARADEAKFRDDRNAPR
jgi:hypothetical protein